MDESEAVQDEGVGAATPIFGVYRRGYDPEQVDRYVADQQRRLDEALHRASESERKLAAAVGQLRELHRRVAVYESEARTTQPPALDSLGERVQRILQEAWEGAYNLRQEAEREVAELRDQTRREVDEQREQAEAEIEELRQVASREASELVDEATRRALALRDEMDRRRQLYQEKVERDRQRAVSQITFLYDQRQLAIAELVRLQTTVQATVEEMVRSPLGKPSAAISDTLERPTPEPELDPAAVMTAALERDAESDRRSEPPATESLAPAPVAETPRTRKISLFEEIIAEPAAPEPAAEPEAPAPWDRLEVQDPTGPLPADEIPTGPMEAVEYGYAAPVASAPAPTESEESRRYGGVYDAETDSWG